MSQLKNTLESQIPIVKNLIYLTEKETFGDIDISLDDLDYDKKGNLYSAMIMGEFSVFINPDFDSMAGTLTQISRKIDNVFQKVSFDLNGKLKKPEVGDINYSGTMLLKMDFSYDDEELRITFNSMFSRI
jgi:hypothetical protein